MTGTRRTFLRLISVFLAVVLPSSFLWAGAEYGRETPVPETEGRLSLAAEDDTSPAVADYALYLGADHRVRKNSAQGAPVPCSGITYDADAACWRVEDLQFTTTGADAEGTPVRRAALILADTAPVELSGSSRICLEQKDVENGAAVVCTGEITLTGEGALEAVCTGTAMTAAQELLPTSCGICAAGLTVNGPALFARGGMAFGGIGCGIWAEGTLTVQAGVLEASAESGSATAYAIRAGGLTQQGGTVLADGTDAQTDGFGVYADTLTMTGGALLCRGKTAALSARDPITAVDAACLGGTEWAETAPAEVEGRQVIAEPGSEPAAPALQSMLRFSPFLTVGRQSAEPLYYGVKNTAVFPVAGYGFTEPAFAPAVTCAALEGKLTGVYDSTAGTVTVTVDPAAPAGAYVLEFAAPYTQAEPVSAAKTAAVLTILPSRDTVLDLTRTSLTYRDGTGGTKTADPTAENITDTGEGWAWYLSGGGYNSKTLVLDNLWLEAYHRTPLNLPGGASVLIRGGSNTVTSRYAGEGYTYGLACQGGLLLYGSGVLNAQAGETAAMNSYGVYSAGDMNCAVSGVLSAGGGRAAGTESMGFSVGLCSMGNLVFSGTGTVTASGADANSAFGVFSTGGVTLRNGYVSAIAGEGTLQSRGVYSTGLLSVTGGTLVGASSCTPATPVSTGVRGNAGMSVSGGTVSGWSGTAGETSNGIWVKGNIGISGASTRLYAGADTVAQGEDNAAIGCTEGVISAASFAVTGAREAFSSGSTTQLYQTELETPVVFTYRTTPPSPTSGGSPVITDISVYSIAMIQPGNGELKCSHTTAAVGTKVQITLAPNKGFALDTLSVTYNGGLPVTCAAAGENAFTFAMPKGNVLISVRMKVAPAEEPPKEEPPKEEPPKEEVPKAEQPAAMAFSDVKPTDWFYEDVSHVVEKKLFNGVTADRFGPEELTIRAMIWTVLGRLDGKELSGKNVYELARDWAMEQGLSDGTAPKEPITREQLAVMLWRYAKARSVELPSVSQALLTDFEDSGAVSDYAAEGMLWAVQAGILRGSHNRLLPGETATRAQVAAMIHRLTELL